MTRKLDDVDADRLRALLADADDPKAVKRLMVALAYEDGESVEALSDRYDVPRSTVYYWLDRFEERPLEAAVRDEDRPGRPPRLDADDREALRADLDREPAELGREADEWTPELVREHLAEEFGVEYSLGHVRRLLREFEGRDGG